MSLIRIRGCTILGPILSEEERAAARVLRERAIRTQYELRQGFQSQHSTSSSGRGAVKPHDTTVRHASTSTSTSGHEDDSTTSTTTTTTTAATTSTDLQPYMGGVESGGDSGGGGGGVSANRSASCDSWMKMTSLIEMDRALLLSSSPDIATDIILGRRHPSSILPRPATTSPTRAPRPDPQDPQEPQSTSVSLSFPSASDGAEGMEELLDGSEEGAGSLPSEVESSDSHVDETPRGVGRAGQQGQRGYRGGVFEAPQRDSGRSSSHSDYLDDYLEQLTRRCSTGLLGLEASTAALRPAPPQQTHSSLPNPLPAPLPAPVAPPAPRPGQEDQRSASAASERKGENRSSRGRARRWSAGQPLDPSRSVGSKDPAAPAGPGDPADLPPAPPSPPCSSFLPCHPHPSSFSSHQEYLDSYLGHLTDDAWLQFPSRLSSRRLIYLSSSDYFASVRKSSSSPSSSSASCPSTSHNGTGSGQEGAQSTDAPSRTPVSPRDPQTDLQSAPITPPDKAKVSSDEGIELLGSPVTPRSPLEKPDVPQTPPVSQGEPEDVPVPQFIVGGPVGRDTIGVDEGVESSSEESSETAPSTIVYVDECVGEMHPAAPAPTAAQDAPRVHEEAPHTSPRKELTSHTSPRKDLTPHASPDKHSSLSTSPHSPQHRSPQREPPAPRTSPRKDTAAPRSPAKDIQAVETPQGHPRPQHFSPLHDTSLTKQSPRRIQGSPRRDTTLAQTRGAPTEPHSSPRRRQEEEMRKQEEFQKMHMSSQDGETDEDEECLVVQVYGDRSPSPPSENSQVVKIVPQRREHPSTSATSANKPVDHVLSLLKAKQEQEVEALRKRQQQEVQQCLQQLQGVTTDQLATLLAPPTPLEAPQKVKVGGQLMVVANATFSLERSGAITPPNLLPLFLGRDSSNDTNNNTTNALNNYTTTPNNNYKPPATSSPSPPPASLPPSMEYYRLCTPEDEDDKFEAELSQDPNLTLQPGLFRVLGAGEAYPSPRPTTITSLLATHPEVFAEEVQSGRGRVRAGEAGLDMVPQRECEGTLLRRVPVHPLANNLVFLKGLVRLQACVRRWLTARLLRTRLVQEQVATLAEIAKLARQFHRDIVADNLHRGDVELHKALYKQEGLARERIWRVFIGLSVQEQMSLLRHDRKLSMAAGAEQRGPQTPTAAPAPATVPATHHHHHHHPHHQQHPNRSVGGKRPSPSPPARPPQETRGARIVTPVKGHTHTHAHAHAHAHAHSSPSHVHSQSYTHTHMQSPAHTHTHARTLRSPSHTYTHAHTRTYTQQQPTYTHTHGRETSQQLYAHTHAHDTHADTHTHAHTQKLPTSHKSSRLPLHVDPRRSPKGPSPGPRSPQGAGRCASHPRAAPGVSGGGSGRGGRSRIPGQATNVGRSLSFGSRAPPSSSVSPAASSPRRAPPSRPPTNRGGRRPWR